MVNKIHHLVKVEEVPAPSAPSRRRAKKKNDDDAGSDA
jgi:hypothetical protein